MKTNKEVNDKGTVSECTWMKTFLMTRQLSNVRIEITQFPGGFRLNYLKDINSTWAKCIHKFLLSNLATFLSFFELQLKYKLINNNTVM